MNDREIKVKGLYSQGVLSGFNIMFDTQRETKYTVSNGITRGAKGDYVTWVDVATPQG